MFAIETFNAGLAKEIREQVGSEYSLFASGARIVAPANTGENVLATITLSADAMGVKGSVIIDSLWSCTNNANVKTIRIRLGGPAGVIIGSFLLTSAATGRFVAKANNRDVANSQIAFPTGSGFGTTSFAILETAVDTTVAQDVCITIQKATSGDVINLEYYKVGIDPNV